jgi:hypothetical protein
MVQEAFRAKTSGLGSGGAALSRLAELRPLIESW